MENRDRNGRFGFFANPILRILNIVIATADIVVLLIVVLSLLVPLINQPLDKEPEIAVCTSPICINEARRITQQIDNSVNPCENFHKFVCKKNSFQDFTTTLKRDVTRQMIELYNEPIENDDHIMVKAMKKLYKTCLKHASDEKWVAKNLQIVKEALKKAGGWPLLEGSNWDETKFDWVEATYKFRELGYYYKTIVHLFVINNPINAAESIVEVSLSKLNVIEKGPAVELAVLLGASRHLASDSIDEINNYIMHLHQNDSCFHRTGSLTTLETFQQQHGDTMNWLLEFINKMVAPVAKISNNDIILIVEPQTMTSGLQLLLKTPKRIIANYMMWKVVMDIAPDILYNSPDKHFAATVPSEIATPEVRCLNQIEKRFCSLPNPIHLLYINKYLPVSKRTLVEDMASNIKAAFLDLLEKANWTNKKDKQTIIKIVKKITMTIGAPESHFGDKIFDMITVDMGKADDDTFLTLLSQIRRNYVSLVYKQLNNFPDKIKPPLWNLMDVTDIALGIEVKLENLNTIEIPATLLQGILFNENRPNYLNYGYLGSLISTQFSMQFKKLLIVNGMLNKIKLSLGKAINCVNEDTVSVYEVCTRVNNTNVCETVEGWDNCLMHQSLSRSTAYMAYEKWTKSNGIEPRLSNIDYTNKQLFWISAMSSYSKITEALADNINIQAFFISVAAKCNMENLAKDFNCYYL